MWDCGYNVEQSMTTRQPCAITVTRAHVRTSIHNKLKEYAEEETLPIQQKLAWIGHNGSSIFTYYVRQSLTRDINVPSVPDATEN